MIQIFNGDCQQVLPKLQINTFDAFLTDPPAAINFMGQAWDGDRGGRNDWCAWLTGIFRECLRVLKPGAHGLVWALPRHSHWTALALEDAGFEIRDCIHHYFLAGFPKSMNVGKAITAEIKTGGSSPRHLRMSRMGKDYHPTGQVDYRKGRMFSSELESDNRLTELVPEARQWEGWGTALKPAIEHWWLVRKPLSEKTVVANVRKWGTGALNIDASRIPTYLSKSNGYDTMSYFKDWNYGGWNRSYGNKMPVSKRKTKLPDDPQVGEGKPPLADPHPDSRWPSHFIVSDWELMGKHAGFFHPPIYCPKARRRKGESNHLTVKPVALMEYFITLLTRRGGHVLDCFAGSFSTGVAARNVGSPCTGIEIDGEYVQIGIRRLAS